MTTAEGTFPKIDGDPFYASEVNKFAGAPTFIGMGSSILVDSGAAFQDVGSVVISAGSLTNPCSLLISASTLQNPYGFQIVISGTSANSTMTFDDRENQYTFSAIILSNLGSPYAGKSFCLGLTDTISLRTVFQGGVAISNLDTGSPVVVKFQMKTPNSNDGLKNYNIQAFRSSI